jgi:16S rRNA (guanine527-N7)-methyltransferase
MIETIQSYSKLILKFNPVLNLISPKDIVNLQSKHISDSVESSRLFMSICDQSNEYSVFDLGSGNGTPGIVWAILNPKVSHTLVEIDQRKAEFLRHCARALDLSNISVINQDFKTIDYPTNAVFTARAFMNLNKLLAPGSIALNFPCYLLKGSTWNTELEGIESLKLRNFPYNLQDGTARELVVYTP